MYDVGIIRNILLIIRSIVWGNNGEMRYGKRPSSKAISFLLLVKNCQIGSHGQQKRSKWPRGIHFEYLWPRNPERRFTNTAESNTFIRLSCYRLCSRTKTSQLSSTPGKKTVLPNRINETSRRSTKERRYRRCKTNLWNYLCTYSWAFMTGLKLRARAPLSVDLATGRNTCPNSSRLERS